MDLSIHPSQSLLPICQSLHLNFFVQFFAHLISFSFGKSPAHMAMAASSASPSSLLFGSSPFNTRANRALLMNHSGISSRLNPIGFRAPSISISPRPVQRGHSGKIISNGAAIDGLASELEESHAENKQLSLPVIDMGKLRRGDHQRKEVVEEIRRACEEWGFFYVINHGVPEETLMAMWKATGDLISDTEKLPAEEKARLQANLFPKVLREKFENKEFVAKYDALTSKRRTIQLDPIDPEDGEASPALEWTPDYFRPAAGAFYKSLRNVGLEFLEAISESLGMPKDSLYKITGRNRLVTSSLHCYYPSTDTSSLGFKPHKDPNTITVLLPDPYVIGLQVLKDKEWVDVKPMKGSLVINLGRAMEALTNGKYKSCLHRVTSNTENARVSIPCFLLPTDESSMYPLPQFIDEHNPALYPHQSYAELLTRALSKSYLSEKDTNN